MAYNSSVPFLSASNTLNYQIGFCREMQPKFLNLAESQNQQKLHLAKAAFAEHH